MALIIPLLDLKQQYDSIKQELEPKLLEQMSSGQYIMGKTVKNLEERLEQYLNVKHAIAVGNGTDALVIALKALGIGYGDEVITTPFTFFATAESIVAVGAKPVFVDVLEDTFNIDPSKIEKEITSKCKAIMPVHLFGQPVMMDEIKSIAEKYNLYVIEDACQAIGASYKAKKAGALGDIGCFSFFPTKNLGCFGDGGLITTDNDRLATICKAYRQHGSGENGLKAYNLMNNSSFNDSLKSAKDETVYNSSKYYNYIVGHNSRLDAIQAVVLDIKLSKLDYWNNKRIEHGSFYTKSLQNTELSLPVIDENVDMVYHQYVVKSNKRDSLVNHLKSNGIATGMYYPIPLHMQKAFEYLDYREGDFPVAEYLAQRSFALPIYPELTMEQKEYICHIIENFYRRD